MCAACDLGLVRLYGICKAASPWSIPRREGEKVARAGLEGRLSLVPGVETGWILSVCQIACVVSGMTLSCSGIYLVASSLPSSLGAWSQQAFLLYPHLSAHGPVQGQAFTMSFWVSGYSIFAACLAGRVMGGTGCDWWEDVVGDRGRGDGGALMEPHHITSPSCPALPVNRAPLGSSWRCTAAIQAGTCGL